MKFKSTILLIVLSVGIIFAGAELSIFNVHPSGGNVILNWTTTSETNLKCFVIERKSNGGNYYEIGTVKPQDNKNYEYVDATVFKTSGSMYKYRLKIVENNGNSSYIEQTGSVMLDISSVKRTWGSIKALFR
jgi:hypothetical protein